MCAAQWPCRRTAQRDARRERATSAAASRLRKHHRSPTARASIASEPRQPTERYRLRFRVPGHVLHQFARPLSDFPVCIITRAPRLPEERARSVEARARMIERGGYGFGERAAALLGSAVTADTLALVQQTVRATNPVGFMQAACFIAEAEMPPLAAGLTMPLLTVQGEEDRVASAATNAELLAAALPHALAPKEAEFVDTVPPRYFGGNV